MKHKFFKLFILLSGLIFAFSAPAFNKVRSPDILEQLRITPKFHKIFPKNLQGVDESDSNIYLLSVEIGVLTESQFIKLKDYFRNQSQISFDRTKSYKLEDFLPPVMQVLLNKRLRSMDMSSIVYPMDEDGHEDQFFDYKVGLRAGFTDLVNCIGTAFETIRVIESQKGVGTYYLYAPGRIDASEKLADKRVVQPVKLEKLKFGDVLYVTTKPEGAGAVYSSQVQHMAIFITKNIFFEKRDSDVTDPYRLVFFEDIQKRLTSALQDKTIRYNLGRFNTEAITKNIPQDDRLDFYKSIEDFFDDAQELRSAKNVFLNFSTQIQNSIWTINADEIGLGGGPELSMSFIEKVQIESNSDGVRLVGNSETLKRFINDEQQP